MAKQSKYIKLSAAQKDEIRRLTQLANRRVANAFKAYEKAGKTVVPSEIVGDIQLREDWHSEKYAFSRSVRFESEKEYREQLHMLRRFQFGRPGIKEYTEIQREKTLEAIEGRVGFVLTDEQIKSIKKADVHQLSDLWRTFQKKSAQLGLKYSSNEAMLMTFHDIFPEDLAGLASSIEAHKQFH